MKTIIKGKVFVLGRDIDTDQMIPAEHLVYDTHHPEERKNYGRYAMSSVPPRFNIDRHTVGTYLSYEF